MYGWTKYVNILVSIYDWSKLLQKENKPGFHGLILYIIAWVFTGLLMLMSATGIIYSTFILEQYELFLFFVPMGLASIALAVMMIVNYSAYRRLSIERTEVTEKLNELDRAYQDSQTEKEVIKLADQSKTDFLNNMSMQLRTPLSSVLGMQEMMDISNLDEEQKEILDNIHTAGKVMEALVDDLSDLGKIEKGELTITPDVFSLSQVIRESYEITKVLTDKKHLEFGVTVDENTPSILYGDVDRIKQIVLNLLTNAIEYTPMGKVDLSVGYERGLDKTIKLSVAVSDTGIGIKEDMMEAVFLRFKGSNNPVEAILSGAGMGLTVTNQVLKRMDSYLEVESEYGQGSTLGFTLLLPVEDETPIGSVEEILRGEVDRERVEVKSFVAPNAKVLAVDDNALNLAVMKGLLKSTRMQVECVSSGKECLEAVMREQFHIILLDHMMPELDGVMTLKKMKELEDNKSADAAVVVVTASYSAGVRNFYVREGFDDYISKPIDLQSLYQIILKYLPEELIVSGDTATKQLATDVLDIQQDIASEFTVEDMKSEIKTVISAMSDFDIERARETLRKLSEEEIPEEYREDLEAATMSMDEEEYEKVALLLDRLLNQV